VIRAALKWLTSGFLDRALGSVDEYIDAQTDKERIKADVVQSYYANRASWMQAGGFVTLLMFAVPVAVWFGAITLYNLFWCAGCAYPQTWSIAAYPAPLDEWAGWIVLACIGGAGAFAWKR